jgi:hypothetical protein
MVLRQFKNYIFDESRWPYIGFLIDQVGIRPTDQDRQTYEILRVVTPADCKISYDRLVPFRHPEYNGNPCCVAHIKWIAHRHGWNYLILDNGRFTTFEQACRACNQDKLRDVVPPLPTAQQKRLYGVHNFFTKFRYALIAGIVSGICSYVTGRFMNQDPDDVVNTHETPTELSDATITDDKPTPPSL